MSNQTVFLVTNIEWDMSDCESDDIPNLPPFVNISTTALQPNPTEDEVETLISDYLSDEYGFCVFGFDYEEL